MHFETFILALILMAICSFFVTLFLKAFYHKKFKSALLYKGLASLCFVIFGAINFFTTEFSFITLIIFVGLCWGIIGDEIIAVCQIHPKHDTLFFLGGGACFIVGHILYVLAMFLLGEPNIIALIIAFVSIVVLCVVYERRRKFLIGKMKKSLMLYICIVIFFSAIGIATPHLRSTNNLKLPFSRSAVRSLPSVTIFYLHLNSARVQDIIKTWHSTSHTILHSL